MTLANIRLGKQVAGLNFKIWNFRRVADEISIPQTSRSY